MLRNVRFYPTITLRSGSSSQGLLVTDVTTAIAMEPGLGMIWMLAVFNASLLNASSKQLLCIVRATGSSRTEGPTPNRRANDGGNHLRHCCQLSRKGLGHKNRDAGA
jgi:hypothetical protein